MKQIEQYNDVASYNAAGRPDTESRVANIKDGNISKFDGVNVPTTNTPLFGDAVYIDENGDKVAIRKDGYNRSLVPSSWTYKGVFLYYYNDGRWAVFLGNYDKLPLLRCIDVSQYAWTDAVLDGEEHEKTIGLRVGLPNWDTNQTITFTYAATTLAEAADTCTKAIEEKLTELGATAATIAEWWAYADEENNRVIVQRDACENWQYMFVSGLTNITWGDMPASDNYRKVNGNSTNYSGIMNFKTASFRYSTNGRTLNKNVAVHGEKDNVIPMKLSEFKDSPYAADIRAYYNTYDAYLRGEFGIQAKLKVGVFALPNGKILTEKYGSVYVPTKAGISKAKFPDLNWAFLQGGHQCDATEGVLIMEDENLAVINETQTKAGKVTLDSNSTRSFAERYGDYGTWNYTTTGRLYCSYTSHNGLQKFQVVAIALL